MRFSWRGIFIISVSKYASLVDLKIFFHSIYYFVFQHVNNFLLIFFQVIFDSFIFVQSTTE